MPRLLQAGLDEALARGIVLRSYTTLELTIPTDNEIRSYYLATGKLNFNGVEWRPELRESEDISASLGADASEAAITIQNVDTLFGIEIVRIEEYLSGAEAVVGQYFRDDKRGVEWHEALLTGLITGVEPDEQVVRLTLISDAYSATSVGPFRRIRRLCQFFYKEPECGRPATDPPTCDKTLNGDGGCHGRWGATDKLIRHGGEPYLDNRVFQKII